MAKVYVLSHGHMRIGHSLGTQSFDSRYIMDIYDSEEKVIEHIRRNIGNRVSRLSSLNRYDEFPAIENFEEFTKLIYARTTDDYATEFQYYIYEAHDVK